MAYCSNCGAQIADNTKFCPGCGSPNTSVSASSPQRQQEYSGKIIKCPSCGGVLKSFEASCPTCGYELRGSQATNSVRELALKLEAIENAREHKPTRTRRSMFDYNSVLNPEISKTDEQKSTIISTFPIPNTKEDLLEFMILAKANINFNAYENDIRTASRAVSDAWKAQFDQAYQKAKTIFGNDNDFYHIEELYTQVYGKVKKAKSKTWKTVGIAYGVLFAIIFGTIGIVRFTDSVRDSKIIPEENKRLDIICREVETNLIDGEYELALFNAESISFNYRNDDSIREWIQKRNTLINKVIREAKADGVILTTSLRPIGVASSDLIGTDYKNVLQLLEKKGFTNISLLYEQLGSSSYKDGEVKSISIDNENYFLAESAYRAGANIVITYRAK